MALVFYWTIECSLTYQPSIRAHRIRQHLDSRPLPFFNLYPYHPHLVCPRLFRQQMGIIILMERQCNDIADVNFDADNRKTVPRVIMTIIPLNHLLYVYIMYFRHAFDAMRKIYIQFSSLIYYPLSLRLMN